MGERWERRFCSHVTLSPQLQAVQKTGGRNGSQSSWYSVLLWGICYVHSLLCDIFKAAMKEAACQRENTRKQNISTSCAITRKWPWAGIGMNFLWLTHVCGISKPLWTQKLRLIYWDQLFCYLIFISFSHLHSISNCLVIMSLRIILSPFLRSTVFSFYYLPCSFLAVLFVAFLKNLF